MAAPGPSHLAGVRVAILNWRDLWQSSAGGAEIFAEEIGRGLAARGASVDFLTAREQGQAADEFRDGIRRLRRGGRWTVYPAVLARLLGARWTRRSYDVVLDCQNGIPFFSPLVVRSRRTAVLLVLHHVHDEQFGVHFPRALAVLGRWLEGPVSRVVYRRSLAIAVSQSTRTAMRRRLAWRGPVELVFNGVHRPIAPSDRRAEPASAPRVVAVGRLVRHKRLDDVVRLVDELADVRPDLEVHVVGRGPEEPRIRAAVAALTHPARVTVHGFLPAAEKDALLRTARLHVSASQGEGWGLSVLEAAALGIPTVAYDVDGLRDAVRDRETGWLAAEGEALARAVDRALDELADPRRAAELRETCVQWAGQFAWEASADRVATLIRAELDRAAARRRSWRSRPRGAPAPARPSAATTGDTEGRLTESGHRA